MMKEYIVKLTINNQQKKTTVKAKNMTEAIDTAILKLAKRQDSVSVNAIETAA